MKIIICSFLLIGQSNMAGRGVLTPETNSRNPNVLLFRNNSWEVAEEPYHQDLPTAGAGLAASFGDELSLKYEKKIGFIPAAFGGTALSEWQPGEMHFENAVKATLEAQKNSKLKGILWHQGENDSCLTLDHALRYEQSFFSFLSPMLREIYAEGLPVIIGELGSFLKKTHHCRYWKEINSALHHIATSNHQIELVSSTDLNDIGDGLHFATPSLRILGRRYAHAWETVAMRLGIGME